MIVLPLFLLPPDSRPRIAYGIVAIDEIVAHAVITFSDKLVLAVGSQGKQQAGAPLDPLGISGIPVSYTHLTLPTIYHV